MIQLDDIGTLYAPTPDEATPPQALPGWHVNATHPIAPWAAWRVEPATPRRVFGGVPTVFYTFPSAADYQAARAALTDADLTPPPPVPGSVTIRQAEQVLILAGLFDQVEPAIAAIPNARQRALMQAWWRRARDIERHHPATVGLAAALGLGDEQLDQLFITGAAL